jgi:hypothetical protein
MLLYNISCVPDEDLACDEPSPYPEIIGEGSTASRIHEQCARLREKWKGLHSAYNQSMAEIINGGAPTPTSGTHTLHTPARATITRTSSSSSSCCRNAYSGMIADRKSEITLMKRHFQKVFDEDVQALCTNIREHCLSSCEGIMAIADSFWTHMMQSIEIKCRLFLARIVYRVTYDPTLSAGKGKFFCWEVCGQELHYLKAEALKRRNGQSPLVLLPKL